METSGQAKGKQGRKAPGRAKGSGSLEKHGNNYRAVWTVNGKVYRRSTGTAKIGEARKKLAEFVAPYKLAMEASKDAKAAKLSKKSGDRTTAAALSIRAQEKRVEAGRLSVPLSKVWECFSKSLARGTVSRNQDRIYECRWNIFQRWIEKNRPVVKGLADIDKAAVEEFMRGIKAKSSPKTFNDYRVFLGQVWKVLDEEAGLDGFNPWMEIKALPKDTHERRELTAEELARVVAPLEGEMRVLFAVGIYTGLRLGDAVTLRWGAVDLVRGFIQTKPHKTKAHGTLVRIPLFPALASILAETPHARRKGFIMPELAAEYLGNATEGRKGYPQYTAERVRRAFEAAGIETHGDTGRANPKNTKTTRKAVEVGFHSLRHTFVSFCGNAGVPLSTVKAIVGHTTEGMTENYFHVSDDALRGAVAVLPDVFRAPSALPAHKTGEKAEVVDAAEAFETVPASVAKVARLLDGCSPAVLARAEHQIEALLASEKSLNGGGK